MNSILKSNNGYEKWSNPFSQATLILPSAEFCVHQNTASCVLSCLNCIQQLKTPVHSTRQLAPPDGGVIENSKVVFLKICKYICDGRSK